jgi:hypothetical protein
MHCARAIIAEWIARSGGMMARLVMTARVPIRLCGGVLVVAIGILTAPAPAVAQSVEPKDASARTGTSAVVGAFRDSLRLLVAQHAARITFQEKTRRELGGPFFGDYRRSVTMPRHWSDGDSFATNNIGHPIQGAATGFIWVANTPAHGLALSRRSAYWQSRLGATAWSAIYSLQFEIGPFSEASIGNVGMRRDTTGWTDYVVTPTIGLAVMVGEDAIDRWVLPWIERARSDTLTRVARTLLNPSRSIANMAGARMPWYRDRPTHR